MTRVIVMNEDARLTVAQAAMWFTKARGTTVTTHTVHGWVRRYSIDSCDARGPRRSRRYLLGVLLHAESRARTNDNGAGRGRARTAA